MSSTGPTALGSNVTGVVEFFNASNGTHQVVGLLEPWLLTSVIPITSNTARTTTRTMLVL
jgi:hypothetical protein